MGRKVVCGIMGRRRLGIMRRRLVTKCRTAPSPPPPAFPPAPAPPPPAPPPPAPPASPPGGALSGAAAVAVKYVPTKHEVLASQVAPSAMEYLGLNDEVWKWFVVDLPCTPIDIIHGVILLVRTLLSPRTDEGEMHLKFEKVFHDADVDLRLRAMWYVIAVWLSIKQIICEYRPPTKQEVIRAAAGFKLKINSKEIVEMEIFVLLRLQWRTAVTLETYDSVINLLGIYENTLAWRDAFFEACTV